MYPAEDRAGGPPIVEEVDHLEDQHEVQPLVHRIMGDGQSCLFGKAQKIMHPEKWKHVLLTFTAGLYARAAPATPARPLQ